MGRQAFTTTDVVRLEVEEPAEGLTNLVQNPDGALGAWGWSTPVPGSVMTSITYGGAPALRFVGGDTPPPLEDTYFTSGRFRVSLGDEVAVAIVVPEIDEAYRAGLVVFDDAGEVLFGTLGPTRTAHTHPEYVKIGPIGDPAAAWGEVRIVLRSTLLGFPSEPFSSITFRDVAVYSGDLGTEDEIPYVPRTFRNILDSSHELTIDRGEFGVGTLEASIVDADLDPATVDLIHPGRLVRVMAWHPDDTWWPLFTGTIRNSSATYNPRVTNRRRVRVQLTATDAVTELGAVSQADGVATIGELPHILEGAGVPWDVNGSGDQVLAGVVVSVNDNASVFDQVAVARDSALGYAWVDRRGVLRVYDADVLAAAPVGAYRPAGWVPPLVDEVAYSAVDVDFDTERVINEVTVTLLVLSPVTGSTDEVTFGPYRDVESIREWGPRRAEFTVQGVLDESDVAAYAAAILSANATPVRRVNAVTIPMRVDDDPSTYGLLDLYDLVSVSNVNAELDEALRVRTIRHTISATRPGKGRWLMSVGFAGDGSVAQPLVTPSPGVRAGGKTISELVRPLGEVTMWFGAPELVPAGWLILDGSTFDGATYPDLEAHLGGTVLPNMVDRFPIGAGSKALGTVGGNPTKTLTVGNLPPHAHGMNHGHTISTRTSGAAAGSNTSRVAAASGSADPDDANTAVNDYSGTTGDSGGTSEPVDVMPPWLALYLIIRAV